MEKVWPVTGIDAINIFDHAVNQPPEAFFESLADEIEFRRERRHNYMTNCGYPAADPIDVEGPMKRTVHHHGADLLVETLHDLL